MPKTGKNYDKTVIYRIPVGDDNYYGHTTQALHKRKQGHKKDYKRQPDRKVYKAMRDIGMNENDIELIWVEDWSCENVDQARARERYWVECDGSLNKCVPNRTQMEYMRVYRTYKRNNDTEWCDKTKEQQRKQKNEKYANDEEWRKNLNKRNRKYQGERVKCDACCKELARGSLSYHKKNSCKQKQMPNTIINGE